jgi:hypothetical protein
MIYTILMTFLSTAFELSFLVPWIDWPSRALSQINRGVCLSYSFVGLELTSLQYAIIIWVIVAVRNDLTIRSHLSLMGITLLLFYFSQKVSVSVYKWLDFSWLIRLRVRSKAYRGCVDSTYRSNWGGHNPFLFPYCRLIFVTRLIERSLPCSVCLYRSEIMLHAWLVGRLRASNRNPVVLNDVHRSVVIVCCLVLNFLLARLSVGMLVYIFILVSAFWLGLG